MIGQDPRRWPIAQIGKERIGRGHDLAILDRDTHRAQLLRVSRG